MPTRRSLQRTRASHRRNANGHPRDLFTLAELESQLAYAIAALERLVADRPCAQVVDVGGLSEPEAVGLVESLPDGAGRSLAGEPIEHGTSATTAPPRIAECISDRASVVRGG